MENAGFALMGAGIGAGIAAVGAGMGIGRLGGGSGRSHRAASRKRRVTSAAA